MPKHSPETAQDKSPTRFYVPPRTQTSTVQEHATLGKERRGSLCLRNTPRWASCRTGEHHCCAHASPNFFCFPGKPAHPGSSQSSAPNLSQRIEAQLKIVLLILQHKEAFGHTGIPSQIQSNASAAFTPPGHAKLTPAVGLFCEKVPISPWQCQGPEPPSPSLIFRAKVCS